MQKGYQIQLLLLVLFYLSSSREQVVSAQTPAQAQQWLQEAEEQVFNGVQLEAALKKVQQARQVLKRPAFATAQVYSELIEGTYWLQQNQFAKAQVLLNKIGAQPTQLSTHNEGLYLTNTAWLLWGLTQYEEALVWADSAANFWEVQEDWEQYSYAQLLGAYALYYNKNSRDLASLETRLGQLYSTVKDKIAPTRLVARHSYQLQSAFQRRQGHIDRAIEFSLAGLIYEQKALAAHQQARDSARVAKTYSQLGQLYADNGNLEQSVGYYTKAFYWYQSLEDYGELVKLCTRLGQLQQRLGHYAQARYYYANLKKYWPKLPSSPQWQRRNSTYLHLAKAYYYHHFQQHDSLLSYYQRALPTIKKYQLAVEKAYLNIGKSATALKQYDKARTAYQSALSYTAQKYGHKGSKPAQLYWTLGQLEQEQGQEALARQHFEQALEALYLGEAPQEGLIDPALFSDKALAAKVYRAQAEVYLAQQNYAAARQAFDQVVELAHYLRDNYTGARSKFSSAQQLRPIYEQAAFCVWKQYQGQTNSREAVEAIFQYAERSKASLLHEHLIKFRNRYAHAGIGVPDSLLQQEERLLVQIARFQEKERMAKRNQNEQLANFYFDKVFELQQRLQALEQTLGQAYPHYKTWDHGRSQHPDLATVQASLSPHQVLVEYLVTKEHCFIIYLTQKEAQLRVTPKHEQGRFEKKVRQLRHLLSHFETAQVDSTTYFTLVEEARWLYQYYLEHPLLEGKKELLLLPDQDLHYIPFETLLYQAPNSTHTRYGHLPYLVRRFALHYHYSAALFLRTRDQLNTPSGEVLGFAASYGTQSDYLSLAPALRRERSEEEVRLHNHSPPIPGTLEELNFLEQYFKGDFFIGTSANERQFKHYFSDKDYGVVHLAMHGTINYNQPAYSSLVFTENLDSLEDNLLYVYETQHLDGQRANLVVLSACKTGYGRYAEGEGIISLGRSFMHAGVPSVVMTLWELNDATSISIMSEFYTLLSKGIAKDEALRQAKLHYLEANEGLTAHPFFWASPILIGNAQPIPIRKRQQPWMIWALVGGLALGIAASWRLFGK